MKSRSVLAAAATLLAVAAVAACDKKEEPMPSETNTTSAPWEQDRDRPIDRPVETTGGTISTGGELDRSHGEETATGSGTGSLVETDKAGAGADLGLRGGRDAGVIGSDWPAVPIDKGRASTGARAPSEDRKTMNDDGAKAKGGRNTSTTLGDGTSGTYTGGKGTYGGKATHGTGDSPAKQPQDNPKRTLPVDER